MKHILYCALAAVIAICGNGCAHNHAEAEHGHHHGHELEVDEGHDHDMDDHHGHNHEADEEASDEIKLSPAAAERFGVEADTIYPTTFNDVVKVTGRIVDNPGSTSVVSAPTAGIVRFVSGIEPGKSVGAGATIANISAAGISGGDANLTAKAAVEAAKRELDRITPLYKEHIVSERDYNAALQAYELAKTQYSSTAANGIAKSISAGAITELLVANGQYVEAGTPIAIVSANKRLTLRADMPERYHATAPLIANAHIKLPYSDEIINLADHKGKRISASDNTTRITPGYIPLYFAFDNDGKALSQSIVEVYLIGAPRTSVIAVPVGAVVEQQGTHFVFRRLDEDCYEKLPVTLGASDGDRVEIVDGLNGGEYIVTKGAMAVKLAESSGAVPEGHSHSH